MAKEPKVGAFIDREEAGFVESLENAGAPLRSFLTPARRKAIEEVAGATINDGRENPTA